MDTPAAQQGLLLLLLLLLAVTASVQACTPGCQPLTVYNDSGGGEAAAYILPSLLLDRGACYSAPSTRSVSVSGGNMTTWSPSPTLLPPSFEQPIPTLDLCTQVQSIWLPQGECKMQACPPPPHTHTHDATKVWIKKAGRTIITAIMYLGPGISLDVA